ncbi:MAG: hypothetical protein H6812_06510 [Phycisphaeraceae bacterium]|nr:hypothetical protein [Phycisphaerales bacterium]MCB9842896.1 hypothetical protein [Phycisphaeraceae bacterium]
MTVSITRPATRPEAALYEVRHAVREPVGEKRIRVLSPGKRGERSVRDK